MRVKATMSLRITRTSCSKMLHHQQEVSGVSLVLRPLYLDPCHFVSLVDTQWPKSPVPTPLSLVHYLEDADYGHEDFTHSSALTLRARASHLFTNVQYVHVQYCLDDKPTPVCELSGLFPLMLSP